MKSPKKRKTPEPGELWRLSISGGPDDYCVETLKSTDKAINPSMILLVTACVTLPGGDEPGAWHVSYIADETVCIEEYIYPGEWYELYERVA